jgi:hypothetical protein
MINIPSVAQLQSDWFKFSDLDRAFAIRAIKQTGISVRKIAAQLHLSESLLRHLLQALLAPTCDQDLARRGKISTNELVRRAKAALRPAKHHEMLAIDRDRDIRLASDLICDWLLQTELFGPSREDIVREVQRKFRLMKEASRHPTAAVPSGTLVSQIIKRTQPPALTDDSIDIVAWYAQWLRKWSLNAFPNENVRDSSLSLALEKQRAS